ncbi:hypothetical protein SMD11_6986 [Streptomyces albireticuli]|uniref:Uncharacterized protein n=1 Tax=Streptomyces albireticuli TaxID=1940 RepID=A0A1Z2LE56_9ACTN|nr:hypothetical protein SMD11_6986 [Streptomyces albireticuli]
MALISSEPVSMRAVEGPVSSVTASLRAVSMMAATTASAFHDPVGPVPGGLCSPRSAGVRGRGRRHKRVRVSAMRAGSGLRGCSLCLIHFPTRERSGWMLWNPRERAVVVISSARAS